MLTTWWSSPDRRSSLRGFANGSHGTSRTVVMRAPKRPRTLEPARIRGRSFDWGTRTYVMGIINVTPDSFSGDGLRDDVEGAVLRSRAFAAAGCDIIDIGGESTRPGHVPVAEAEELGRVLPAIEAVRAAVDLPISIDTFK